jgi:hypothetical protein
MEKQIVGSLMALLMALAAWNMKTVNDLQLEMREVMVNHATAKDIEKLRQDVLRLQWILHDDAVDK